MSDDEEEVYGFYGKPLEQYDEESMPKKRPISVEEQIATDTQGRRRFHGAFTGGFSAGFFNTVGSADGWTPTEFKSSRGEKAEKKEWRPEDYMDDEDVGEFGIAPQQVRATKDYSTRKRKKPVFSEGPIPGDPVLHTLIENSSETIGYILLRNMGFKHTPDEPELVEETPDEGKNKKIYGCEMPKPQVLLKKSYPTVNIELPQIYMEALSNPKANSFGLGYSGLDKSHGNVFKSTGLVVNERGDKKLSIKGQAFGVGAFEEEDDDIYSKDDLSNYDFEMTSEKAKIKSVVKQLILGLFVQGKAALSLPDNFPPPSIPGSFTGKHKVKKSRFEPIIKPGEAAEVIERKNVNADVRAKALGEKRDVFLDLIKEAKKKKEEERQSRWDVKSKEILTSNFVSSKTESQQELKGGLVTDTATLEIKTEIKDEAPDGAPGLVLDKFVAASSSTDHLNVLEPVHRFTMTHGTKDQQNAARMKMFGALTRITETWAPVMMVYRRFNVPEPAYSEQEMKPKQKVSKPMIFEYESFTVNDPITIRTEGLLDSATSMGVPASQMGLPTSQVGQIGLPNSQIGLPSAQMGLPTSQIGLPNAQIGQPSIKMGQSSTQTGQPSTPTGQPTTKTGQPNTQTVQTSTQTGQTSTKTEQSSPKTAQLSSISRQHDVTSQYDTTTQHDSSNYGKKITVLSNELVSSTVDSADTYRNKKETSFDTKNDINQEVTKHVTDLTQKIDVSKNIDLFKAVFLDSDDEGEDAEEEDEATTEDAITDDKEIINRQEAIKEQILSDDLLLPKIKNASKVGILSDIDFDMEFQPVRKEENKIVITKDESYYGPKLPEKLPINKTTVNFTSVQEEDEWVEKKSSSSEDDQPKKEKNKKHKHKKKSKKHKHKKKHK